MIMVGFRMTLEIEKIHTYKVIFPEDADRMTWAWSNAVTAGLTDEFGYLISRALELGERVDWGPLFEAARSAR